MASVPRNRMLIAAILFMFLFMLMLIAAFWQPVSTWFAPAAAPQKIKLTIAVNDNHAGSGLVYLAQANGHFLQQGLDVTLLPCSSSWDTLAALLERRADLATSSDTPVMFAALEGQPIVIIATIFLARRDNGIVARRDRGIASITDLKNKTVGVALKTDGHFVLSAMLARHQMSLTDVHTEPLMPTQALAALESGQVDAISTWEPGLSVAANALGDNAILFRIEGRFAFEFNLVGAGIWVKSHPEPNQRLLRALLLANSYSDQHPGPAQSIIATAMKLDAGTFAGFVTYEDFVVELSQNLLSTLEDQARWAIQNGLVNSPVLPNFLHFIDMDALTAVKPDAVTIVR